MSRLQGENDALRAQAEEAHLRRRGRQDHRDRQDHLGRQDRDHRLGRDRQDQGQELCPPRDQGTHQRERQRRRRLIQPLWKSWASSFERSATARTWRPESFVTTPT